EIDGDCAGTGIACRVVAHTAIDAVIEGDRRWGGGCGAGPADQDVVAFITVKPVVAYAALKQVVAEAAPQRIVSAIAKEAVGFIVADQGVMETGALDVFDVADPGEASGGALEMIDLHARARGCLVVEGVARRLLIGVEQIEIEVFDTGKGGR